MKVLKKNLSIILTITMFCVLLSGCSSSKTEVVSSTEVKKETETESITTIATTEETTEETTVAPVTDPINFIMFGIDVTGDTPGDDSRSDMIMCVSLNPQDNTIRFASILRDTKAEIEGHSPQKINGAYQFGGSALAINTVNQNFGMDFSDYITLDWSDVAILVDEIGGVDVEISDLEAQTLNSMVWKDVVKDGRNANCKDVQGGLAHLDGTQALHFSRIRAIDSDYYRAGRQQRTLIAIIEKIKNMPITEYPALIKTFKETVEETSFSVEDILRWTTMGLDKYDIKTYIVPDPDYEDNLFGGIDDTGSWVWIYDLNTAGNRLKQILSGEFDK